MKIDFIMWRYDGVLMQIIWLRKTTSPRPRDYFKAIFSYQTPKSAAGILKQRKHLNNAHLLLVSILPSAHLNRFGFK